MNFRPEAILSLIATAFSFVAFLLMLEESIALRQGKDPMSNGVRSRTDQTHPPPQHIDQLRQFVDG